MIEDLLAIEAGGETTAADACLSPLLHALDWIGEPRHLHEALPDGETIADFAGLVEVLGHLGFTIKRINANPAGLDGDALPAVIRTRDDDIWVLTRQIEPGVVEAFKGRTAQFTAIRYRDLRGRCYIVTEGEAEQSPRDQGRFGWISGLLERENSLIRLLFGVAFVINAMALALPVYMLSVYDLAIGARSAVTLSTLAFGILVIIAADAALRELRAHALARFAVRIQIFVMSAVFERLMRLPASYVESASVAGQLNRLRSFEGVRDIFSGPLAASLLDMPFIFVFVAAVFTIGGSLGWFLVAFIVILALMATVFIPRARRQTHRAGAARSEARLFRADVTQHLATIRDSSAKAIWIRRYRDLTARQIHSGALAQQISFSEQIVAQALSAVTGALIVGFGAVEVIHGALSLGALAAVMAIVWRVLAPIQTAMLNIHRVFQALDTAKQINQLMKLPQESGAGPRKAFVRMHGDITLENVAFRSNTFALPILRGIDLKVRAGELVVLTGAPGPSRSTLLKIVANLYPPTVGRVRIDGSDVRQFDIRELRRNIALVNEEQIIFSGTLAQNLLLANPFASDGQIRQAIHETNLDAFLKHLGDGIDTDLTELLHSGLSASLCQKIRLARAYLQGPSIYLFDEPTKDMTSRDQQAFLSKLLALKGASTVIIRTSDPRILAMADKIAVMEMGLLRLANPAAVPAGGKPSQQQLSAPRNAAPA